MKLQHFYAVPTIPTNGWGCRDALICHNLISFRDLSVAESKLNKKARDRLSLGDAPNPFRKKGGN